jgi:hypothetical protein
MQIWNWCWLETSVKNIKIPLCFNGLNTHSHPIWRYGRRQGQCQTGLKYVIQMMIKYWLAAVTFDRKSWHNSMTDLSLLGRIISACALTIFSNKTTTTCGWCPKEKTLVEFVINSMSLAVSRCWTLWIFYHPFSATMTQGSMEAFNVESVVGWKESARAYRCTRVMLICTAGSRDNNWSFGKPLEFLPDAGVSVEYKLEYTASTENCKHAGGALDLVHTQW